MGLYLGVASIIVLVIDIPTDVIKIPAIQVEASFQKKNRWTTT